METGLRNRKFHELLAQQASSAATTPSWGAALARALQGGIAGMIERGDNASEMEANNWQAGLVGPQAAAQPAQTASPLASAMSQPPQGQPGFANAIASIESGGKYDRLGPVTKTGDRAYGKYQVMGANVPQWTKAHLGQPMTAEEFLKNPQAQDAVFNGQFGQYAQKYGPEGAAKAWFAGERGMNNPNARDQLGTTVASYAQKFNKALGPQQSAAPQPLAMALQQPEDGAALPPNAQPTQGQMPPPQQVAQATDANAALRAQIQQGLTSSNRAIRERAQAYAAGIINKQLEGDKPTDEIREYNLYKQQGGTKNFFDYKADLKKAGSTQVIQTMDQKAESAFDTKAGQLQAERLDKIVQDGASAKTMISDMTALTDIGSRITTGKTAEIAAALGPYAEMLGVKVDTLGDLQAYNAIVRKLAPQMRVPGSGATSDFEMRNFLEALPGLGKTPEGNATIAKVFGAIQEQKLAAADIASKVLNKEITRSAGEKMLRDLPDPLALWQKNKGTSAVAKPDASAPPPGALEEARRRGLIK
jgi:hypothetical protein